MMVKKSKVFLSGATLTFYAILYLTNWQVLKITGIKGYKNFIDLGFVLEMAKCLSLPAQNVTKEYDGQGCSGYIYGSTLLKTINALKVTSIPQEVLGVILGLSLIGILIYSANSSHLNKSLSFLIIGSPGIWLLLERGNFDIVMVLLTGAAAVAVTRNHFYVGLAAIIYASLIKFYTVPLFFLTFLFARTKTKKLTLTISMLATVIIVYSEVSKLGNFPSTWYISFGMQSMGLWFQLIIQRLIKQDFILNTSHLMAIGFIYQFLITFVISKCPYFRLLISNLSLLLRSNYADLQGNLYRFFILIFVVCYLAGMNYDYRLIFLALGALPMLAQLYGRDFRIMSTLVLTSLWFSCFFFGIDGIAFVALQAVGDFTASVLVGLLILGFLGSILKRTKRTQV